LIGKIPGFSGIFCFLALDPKGFFNYSFDYVQTIDKTLRVSLDNQTAAGDRAFCLRQLRNIDCYDAIASFFQPRASFGEGSWKDDGSSNGEAIGRMWLRRIDFDDVKILEVAGVHPIPVDKQSLIIHTGHSTFQVKAAM
jgi:hypothetical protein